MNDVERCGVRDAPPLSHFVLMQSFISDMTAVRTSIVCSELQSSTPLFRRSEYSSFGLWQLFPLALISSVSLSLWFSALIFWHYQVLQTPICPSAPVLESAIFPRSLGSCYWRTVSAAKIWKLGMLIASWASLLLVPLSWQRKEIYVCMLTLVCIISIYISERSHLGLFIKLKMSLFWCLQL